MSTKQKGSVSVKSLMEVSLIAENTSRVREIDPCKLVDVDKEMVTTQEASAIYRKRVPDGLSTPPSESFGDSLTPANVLHLAPTITQTSNMPASLILPRSKSQVQRGNALKQLKSSMNHLSSNSAMV